MHCGRKIAVALLLAELMSARAEAAYVFTFYEQAGGVSLIGTGSVLLHGLSPYGTNASRPSSGTVDPELPFVSAGGGGSVDLYYPDAFESREAYGTGGYFSTSTSTGPAVGFQAGGNTHGDVIQVPNGYRSEDLIGLSTAFFAGSTFASLGLTPGTYVYNYTTPQSEDSFTVQIVSSQVGTVPLPASAPMFGAGLIALGAASYAVKRKMEAAAF